MRTNRSIPDATVIPVLVYPDVRAAVAWLSDAFGFVERVRIGERRHSPRPIRQWRRLAQRVVSVTASS